MNLFFIVSSFPRRRESPSVYFSIQTVIIILCLLVPSFVHANTEIKNFLSQQFDNQIPKPKRVWINLEKKSYITTQINPSQIKLSYRYWQNDKLNVWILDEIGKERNITTGIVIEGQTIKQVKVIVFRESRGGQVQNNRFTQQYYQKHTQSNLIKEIDSISGATLSVNAINKQVKLALWLNQQIDEN